MKILLVNDFSQLSTGYAKYGHELLTRFHRDGYETAELALFCDPDDERIKNCPWVVYPNLPYKNQEPEYERNSQNTNGKWKFEPVCLDFKPNFVLSITDPYFNEFQKHSPFRKYFNWITMATVDGLPQHTQWLDLYKNADGLITYTDWGKDVLENYGLKIDGVASPASSDLYPIKKDNIKHFKHSVGLGNKIVIGTIMRNQPRKLFDALFQAFSKLSKEDDRYILYCHTTYPDGGWDLGELLIKHNISSKVLFTYQCLSCGEVFFSNFADIGTFCKSCGAISAKMPGGQSFVDNSMLNKIINIFDCYIQFASREGFGMPQVEAAACNIPIVTIPYAGMVDSVKKLDANPVNINSYYLSYPMNMMEAVPDIDDAINQIKKAVNKSCKSRELYLENYNSWEKPYQVFKNIIEKLPIKEWKKVDLKHMPEYQETNIDNNSYIEYLLSEVYNRPDLINSYLHARLLRDLSFGITHGGVCGNYLTENVDQKSAVLFDNEIAYKILANQRQFDDFWQYQLNEVL